jgi:hypothetical protein
MTSKSLFLPGIVPVIFLVHDELFILFLHPNHFIVFSFKSWFCIKIHLPLFSLLLYSSGPPPWSIGQGSWLQIQRSRFDSRHYQIFWEVVGLERGPLSLVSTIELLLKRKGSSSGLEIQEYGHRDPSRWPCGTPLLYLQKLALTSPTKRQSLGQYSLLANSGQGVFLFSFFYILFSATKQTLKPIKKPNIHLHACCRYV